MSKHFTFLLSVCIFVCISCKQDVPSVPVDPIVDQNCGNDAQISAADSAYQQWPTFSVLYELKCIDVSSGTRLWAGESRSQGWQDSEWERTFVYDPKAQKAITYLDALRPMWSPNGDYLLCTSGFGAYEVFSGADLRHIASYYIPFSAMPSWSTDGRAFYYTVRDKPNGGTLYRLNLENGESNVVLDSLGLVVELSEEYFFGINYDGLYLVDKKRQAKMPLHFTWLNYPKQNVKDLSFYSNAPLSISPDRTKILVDLLSNSGFMMGRAVGGLFLFDLKLLEARRIREQQYWGTPYYPKWVTNDRFYGTYFCRSTQYGGPMSMVWEYDLKGNVIKQVTYPWMAL